MNSCCNGVTVLVLAPAGPEKGHCIIAQGFVSMCSLGVVVERDVLQQAHACNQTGFPAILADAGGLPDTIKRMSLRRA
jgi:hypothetical protein